MSNNLDLLAAQTAQKITKTVEEKLANVGEDAKAKQRKSEASSLENMVTKALGVLQENGVYAGLLFLYARGGENYAKELREQLLESLKEEPIKKLNLALLDSKEPSSWNKVGPHLTAKICADLDTLFLVKQLWEQTLIYARYGAKAQGKE